MSIVEVRQRLLAGRATPEQLVDACLERIRRVDHRVRAWAFVDEQGARREAARQTEMLAAGRRPGPLQGIPLGIKDIVDVQGLPTEAGSQLLAGRIAERDAPAVGRLRAAGAIILGKTVTTEFACFDPAPTRNPWNPQHTPGGSSSGSAAAVAAGMCLGAIGSQTGGSIIRPASYCGVAGMKPSFGRIETAGVVPVSQRLDHVGPIAGSVADLAQLFVVLDAGGGGVVPGERMGSPPDLFRLDAGFLDEADPAVRELIRAAYGRLEAAGAVFPPLDLPASFAQCRMMHRTIMAVDAAETHFATFTRHQSAYGPRIAELLQKGLSTFAVDYALALRHQPRFREDMSRSLQGGRVAVMPATDSPPPAGLESTGDPRFQSPWSYAGLPAVTIPCGLSPRGLPCGLQLIAGPGEDATLLAAAAWCEHVLGFAETPPDLADETD